MKYSFPIQLMGSMLFAIGNSSCVSHYPDVEEWIATLVLIEAGPELKIDLGADHTLLYQVDGGWCLWYLTIAYEGRDYQFWSRGEDVCAPFPAAHEGSSDSVFPSSGEFTLNGTFQVHPTWEGAAAIINGNELQVFIGEDEGADILVFQIVEFAP